MSGFRTILSLLDRNKEPHVPTGGFLRTCVLEAGYRNRFLLCPNHFCPLQEVTWDPDDEKPRCSCQRCKKECLRRNKTGPRVRCWQSLWEQSLPLRRCCNMAELQKGQGRVLASCGKCSFTGPCLRRSPSSCIPV